MTKLIVRHKIWFNGFGGWKWKKADHDVPLTLRLPMATAQFYVDEDSYSHRGISVMPRGRIDLVFDPAPHYLLNGIKANTSAASRDAAALIHHCYSEALLKLEALLMSAGRVRYFMGMGLSSIDTLYRDGVEWATDGGHFTKFEPRLAKRRGRNPLYKSEQLVTPSRWKDMQEAWDEGDVPDGELLELYRIRAKAGWRELRVATIEASIVSETLLRSYAIEVLKKNGFSNTRLKRLRDEMTFNNLLNVVLPLSLKKSDLKRLQPAISSVDRLRALRNDLVHGNITQKDVDPKDVETGIDGAIALVRFMQTKVAP